MTLLYTNNFQSIRYYGILRRYNWSKCGVRWLRFHLKRILITDRDIDFSTYNQ